ncbi:dTDP-4-dehydrorhamnose 3,5-epimerase family protein [Corynebacterium sp.]|uniref:dTDP-4-dehydrorhamnose 3,5-epimerase family protein n=1 Tax=Corynebacterium sp. TaxID=1720 RepID=UPI0025BA63AA|nr:dTDP-4-dehydrorhamnose 3,5-epimerase family protein [Corynebacterium sp.]
MNEITDLEIPGAWVAEPRVFADDRGTFHEWFRADVVADKLGHPLDIPQANLSTSREGVVRGIHFADVPPGQAKYVTCVAGRVIDVLVDLRRGSPTYLRHVAVELSAEKRNGVYVPIGVGHAFGVPAGAGGATVSYLVSEGYDPQAEHAVTPFDPELGIDWDALGVPAADAVLSDKDREAPTVADIGRDGPALPSWNECRGWEKELRLAWEQAQDDAENWEGE